MTQNQNNGHFKSFAKGDQVKVLSSKHPDVIEGTIGTIDCHHVGGYGVAIDGNWLIAGNDRGARIQRIEVIWYQSEDLELIITS